MILGRTSISPRELSSRLVLALCLAAIAIGVTVLIGYAAGSVSIASLGTNGKPGAAVSALLVIALGGGLLALRQPSRGGSLTPRIAALGSIAVAAGSFLSAALSRNLDEWQMWGAHGGVYFHPFPVTDALALALGAALMLVAARRDRAAHVIASLALLACVVFLFGYVLRVPSFLDPRGRVAPVVVTAVALMLLSTAAVVIRPRGWVIPLLSRTSAGAMSRSLLPSIFVVPLFAVALNHVLTDDLGDTPQVGLTVVVAVNAFFGAAILFGAGTVLYRRESERLRLAAIVSSSNDAIVGLSSTGIIESWNAGAEQMYGYTAAEVVGRAITVLAPPDRRGENSLLIERAWRGERVESVETVRVAKGGRRLDVLLTVSPVLDEEGNLAGASAIAHDVTERKQMEQALRDSEAALAEAQEIAQIGSWIFYPESGEASVSPETFRIFGVEPRSHVRMPKFLDLVHEEDRDAVAAGIAESASTSKLDVEFRVHTALGLRVVRAIARKRETGEPTPSMIGTIQDVTERRSAEEALKKSEAALRAAQRTAAVGHWEWAPRTGVLTWSDETYRILEIAKGSVEPSIELFASTIVAKDRGTFEQVIAGALQPGGENDFSLDLGVITPAGTALTVLARILVDRDATGNALQLHGTMQDITRRVADEQALRDSEASLEEAQQIARIGSWILYPESGELRASAEMFRMFGVDRDTEELLPAFTAKVHDEDRAAVVAAIAEAARTETLDVEFRIVTPQETRVARAIARKREVGEPQLSLIGTTRDITEQKAAEEAIRQHSEWLERSNLELERSNLELERFNRLAVGRELRMIELKKQINDLCAELGQPLPYVLPEEHGPGMEASR